jgi:hypothetical protein
LIVQRVEVIEERVAPHGALDMTAIILGLRAAVDDEDSVKIRVVVAERAKGVGRNPSEFPRVIEKRRRVD